MTPDDQAGEKLSVAIGTVVGWIPVVAVLVVIVIFLWKLLQEGAT